MAIYNAAWYSKHTRLIHGIYHVLKWNKQRKKKYTYSSHEFIFMKSLEFGEKYYLQTIYWNDIWLAKSSAQEEGKERGKERGEGRKGGWGEDKVY